MMPCRQHLLALTLLAFPLLPRTVMGVPSVMRAESGTGRRPPALSGEVLSPDAQDRSGMEPDSLLERNAKVRSNTGQKCWAADPSWKQLNSTDRRGVIYIDLGVEACQSSLMFLGESVEDSCKYAADKRLAGGLESCIYQNTKVKEILEFAAKQAQNRGYHIFADQKVVMVEAGPQYNQTMKEVQARYPNVVQFVPYAITAGHDDHNTTGVVYDTRQKTVLPEMVARGNEEEHVKVKPLNLNRLLTYVAREEDYVILKMDIEGAEYDIVPCLAASPAAKLVDVFLLERHDKFTGSKPGALTDALSSLKAQGVKIRTDWP
mmetsp:Transcript_15196/g.28092  ORF Transcript_15196/g.28092 Transcript_15196/m.28092 type:complete len:319 (-) Transcript_15196:48-1004(-)